MTRAREAARLIGNNTFRLDSNNAVGFNSTTPDAMFDINHGLTVAGVSTFTGNVTMEGDLTVQGTTTTLDTTLQEVDLINVQANASVPGLGVTQSGSGKIVAFYDSTTEVFTVRDGGAVAIGNNGAAPGSNALVEIRSTTGSINSATLRVSGEKTTTGAVDTGSTLLLSGHDGGSGRDFASLFAAKENGTGSNHDAYLAFGTRANGSTIAERLRITSAGNVSIQNDSGKFTVGASDDLQIYHDGTNSRIYNDTGELVIRNSADDKSIYLQTDDSSGGVATYVLCEGTSGKVYLYHYGSEKLQTKSDGVDITGELQCDSLDVDGAIDIDGGQITYDNVGNNLHFADNANARFGTGSDLRIYHDGSTSRIDNHVGSIVIKNLANDADIQLSTDDGSGGTTSYVNCDGSEGKVKLYYYGSEKLQTRTDGVLVTGEVQSDSLDVDGNSSLSGDVDFVGDSYSAIWDKSANRLLFQDNAYIALGTGADASLYVNGNHAYLDLQSGIGNFYIRDGTTTRFTFDDGGDFTATGNVTAYSDVTLKENIETIPNALDKVLRLRGVEYDRIDREEHQIGVIAQEIEEVIPEVVITNEEGIKSVAYGNLVGLLIESVKELKAEVNDLKAKLEE